MSDDTHQPIEPFELEPEPTKQKRIVKPKYTEAFLRFWKAYPRKTAKLKAFQSWQNHVDETDRDSVTQIIGDLEKRTRARFWAADQSKIPMPTTFINQHRWEDEWEPEVKTRGKETMATYSKMPEAKVDDAPKLSNWRMMLNRIMRDYIFLMGGTTDAMMAALIKTKNDTWAELKQAVNEEIEISSDKRKAHNDMGWLLAETMLNRFDAITSREYKRKILNMSKRPA